MPRCSLTYQKVVQASEICKARFAISYNERSLTYQKLVQTECRTK